MSGDKGISAFPESDNLFKWVGTIDGAQGTVCTHGSFGLLCSQQKVKFCSVLPVQVYEGLRYRLSLEFPAGYPYQAPRVKFVTPCFHPNVDEHGFICLDILKDKWSALYDVRSILLSIQSLLGGKCVITPALSKLCPLPSDLTVTLLPPQSRTTTVLLMVWRPNCGTTRKVRPRKHPAVRKHVNSCVKQD